MMECAKSLEMLSEFHAGTLDESAAVLVHIHLAECPPCLDVFQDLALIVSAAGDLRGAEGITFPDETALWQRMRLTKHAVH